ncbi:hypothetical protein [Streptomyces syringium]|uniref:hypothetical protein n=1 Tax=Streptomyces syringium TaxID=76729 RepID=UPI0033A5CC16
MAIEETRRPGQDDVVDLGVAEMFSSVDDSQVASRKHQMDLAEYQFYFGAAYKALVTDGGGEKLGREDRDAVWEAFRQEKSWYESRVWQKNPELIAPRLTAFRATVDPFLKKIGIEIPHYPKS